MTESNSPGQDVVLVPSRAYTWKLKFGETNLMVQLAMALSRVPIGIITGLLITAWLYNAWGTEYVGPAEFVPIGLAGMAIGASIALLLNFLFVAPKIELSRASLVIHYIGWKKTATVPFASIVSVRRTTEWRALWEGWIKTVIFSDAPNMIFTGKGYYLIEWVKKNGTLGSLFFPPEDEALFRSAIERFAPQVLDLDPLSDEDMLESD